MENLKDFNEKQEGKRKREEEEQGSMGSASSVMRDAQRSMPNFNSSSYSPGNFKMPSMPSLPNFKF